MEREPSREYEQEPLTDDCMHCGKEYDLTDDNSRAFMYFKQPECNHLIMMCSHCDGLTFMFLAEDGDSIEKIREHGLPVDCCDFAPPDVYSKWMEINDIQLIKSHDVTPRQEKRIDFLRYLLEHDMITPDDF